MEARQPDAGSSTRTRPFEDILDVTSRQDLLLIEQWRGRKHIISL